MVYFHVQPLKLYHWCFPFSSLLKLMERTWSDDWRENLKWWSLKRIGTLCGRVFRRHQSQISGLTEKGKKKNSRECYWRIVQSNYGALRRAREKGNGDGSTVPESIGCWKDNTVSIRLVVANVFGKFARVVTKATVGIGRKALLCLPSGRQGDKWIQAAAA